MPTNLTTERLHLRELVEEDAAAFHILESNPAVRRFIGPGTSSIEHARTILREYPLADYRKHGFGRLACVLKEDGQLIGMAGLKHLDDLAEVDVGYRLLPDFWGRGLATEAARAVVAYGFQTLGLERIIGLVDPENVASVRVLQKLGLVYEGMIEYRSAPAARYVISRAQFLAGGDR